MSVTELAKQMGVTKGLISQLKKAGMPMTSLEEASAWRETNAKPRVWKNKIQKLESIPKTVQDIGQDTIKLPEETEQKAFIGETGDQGERSKDPHHNPYDSLRDAKIAERLARNRLVIVSRGEDQIEIDRAQRTFNMAQRHRMYMQKEVKQWQRENGIIIYVSEAKQIYGDVLQALGRLINVMPKSLAQRCVSPQLAEQAMNEYCDRIRKMLKENLTDDTSS